MARDTDFEADLARYPKRPFLREQSIWAIWVYRWGRRILKREPGFPRSIALKIYWLLFRLLETATGISLPLEAHIGPGLLIHHFGNIFLHPRTVLGSNVTLRQGVTIGNRRNEDAAPFIEDDVEFGAYAQVLGSIRVGRGARIGAMSVVLFDVPAGATVVGNPARIVASSQPAGLAS